MTQVFLRDQQQTDEETISEGRLWNTGNYFFLDAVERQVVCDDVVYSVRTPVEADTLVLSMSNFISANTDMGHFADYIARNDFERVVMIGAGTQDKHFSGDVPLQDGTLRFLHEISDRCTSIGVRGEYTAYVLAKHGITNVRVIGCPTIFWSQDRDFRVPGPARDPQHFSVNFTPVGHYRDKLALLLREALAADAQFVAQDERFLPVFGEDSVPRRQYASIYFGGAVDDKEALEAWFAREKHFYSIPEWIAHLRGYDFVCGTRFHGNMAAIQAGLAPLNLVHDSRTKELCDFLNLPYLNISRYVGEPLRELAAMADYSLFNATYRDRFENYVEFLEENGLSHRLRDSDDPTVPEPATAETIYLSRALSRLHDDIAAAPLTDSQKQSILTERLEPLRPPTLSKRADNGTFTPEQSSRARGNLSAYDIVVSND